MGCRTSVSGLALLAGILASGSAFADPVTPERLLAAGTEAEAGNWLMVHRTYDSQRFSPLNEINASNVKGLKLAFAVPLGGLEPSALGIGAFEGTPLANNGKLYIADPWGTPYKIDLTNGKRAQIEWIGETGINKDPAVGYLIANRGLGLWNDLVITVLLDGRVIAFDDATGDIVWEKKVATEPGEGFSNAPLVIGDRILVGQSLGDWATRGWIASLDARTGEEQWRFHTVPAPGEPGSETWLCDKAGNPDCWKTGGAAAWVTGSYDPESKTTIWGTGNPVPMFDPEYRPGDNLYSNSTIALDLETGKLKWYFQYTPGDYLDYDETGSQLLVDTEINGEARKVVAHFGRNGFFYTLDRTNGAFIQATQYVEKINWTEGIDPKTGKPVNYDPTKELQVYAVGALRRDGQPVQNCPHLQGGVNFWPTAYNPGTGLAYGHSIEGCSELKTVAVNPEDVVSGQIFLGGSYTDQGAQDGSIVAFDVKTGKQVAKVMREYPGYAGVLTTPELVIFGELDGTVAALDAKTLQELWSINVGNVFKAPPMTFTANGKQYIAIVGGSLGLGSFGHPEIETAQPSNMLYVFSL
jgi:alcohol dehydrogenase (cytochrome c)